MLSYFRRARADLAFINQLLPAAERIAHHEGAERPDVKHLVLAAIDQEDGIARCALDELGVSAADLRAGWEAQQDQALKSVGIRTDLTAIDATVPTPHRPRVYQSEPALREALQRAFKIAKSTKSPLSSGHVLLAVAEDTVSELARVFDLLGIDRRALRRRLGL